MRWRRESVVVPASPRRVALPSSADSATPRLAELTDVSRPPLRRRWVSEETAGSRGRSRCARRSRTRPVPRRRSTRLGADGRGALAETRADRARRLVGGVARRGDRVSRSRDHRADQRRSGARPWLPPRHGGPRLVRDRPAMRCLAHHGPAPVMVTKWGLLQHYWVVIKLLMSIFATIVLVPHMRPVGIAADEAAASTLTGDDLSGLRLQLVADAIAAILLLLVAATLSVFEPPGRTRATAGGSSGAPRDRREPRHSPAICPTICRRQRSDCRTRPPPVSGPAPLQAAETFPRPAGSPRGRPAGCIRARQRVAGRTS